MNDAHISLVVGNIAGIIEGIGATLYFAEGDAVMALAIMLVGTVIYLGWRARLALMP